MSESAGRVLMIPKGTYSPTTTYDPLDSVNYEHNSYVCKQTSRGNLPTNTTYWQPLTDVTADEIPTEGSTNLVQSGGVYSANQTLTSAFVNNVNENGCKNRLLFDLADVIANNTSGTWNGKTFTQTGSTIAFTLNDDGSISVNGTANSSATATLYLYGKSSLAEENIFKGMILNGCPNGGTTNGYSLIAQGFDTSAPSSGTNYNDLGGGVTIGDKDYLRVYVRVQAGVTVNNLTFKPMIRLATDSDSTFEPPTKTNRQLTEDSVTWDNLSEVGAVNHCKNNATTTTTTDGTTTFTWTVNDDKSVTVSAPSYPVTVVSNQNLIIWSSVSAEESKILVNKVWRLTGCPNSDCIIELFRVGTAGGIGGTLYDNGEGLVFTWLNNASGTKVNITLAIKSGTTLTEAITFKPMIAPVEYNGPYVPYAMTNKELTDIDKQMSYINPVSATMNIYMTSDAIPTFGSLTNQDATDIAQAMYDLYKKMGGKPLVRFGKLFYKWLKKSDGTQLGSGEGSVEIINAGGTYNDCLSDNSKTRMRISFKDYGYCMTTDYALWGSNFTYLRRGTDVNGTAVDYHQKETIGTISTYVG